jgi:hypothetical protein
LEGLEVVEVNFDELENEIRIDAELYEKKVVSFERKIKKKPHTTFEKEASLIKKGIFDIKSDTYSEIGIPFVRISNLKNCGIETNDIIYIPEAENDKNLSTFLKRNDIILSKTANAAASIVDIDFCNTSQDTVAIKLKANSQLNSQFVVAYLNSDIGIKQMQRWFTGNIQMHLNLTVCKEKMLIPIFSQVFQDKIKHLFDSRLTLKLESKNYFQQAETLLLQSTGLLNFKSSEETVNIKTFKDSFGTSGRLDAEHYKKKFEEIEIAIITNGFYKISDIYYMLSNPSPSEYQESGIKVIKTKNIRIPSVEIANITDHTYESKVLVQKNDLLFASMGVGSLGRLSYIDSEIENCTTDGTLKIFRAKEEFRNKNLEIPALLFLTSQYGQELIYKYVIGSTGIISISKENIENLIVPKVTDSIALKLTELVHKSQQLKIESEKLLEVAKKAVEMAIEEGEERVMEWVAANSGRDSQSLSE